MRRNCQNISTPLSSSLVLNLKLDGADCRTSGRKFSYSLPVKELLSKKDEEIGHLR
ncbi:hypothetical protein BDE02_07G044200 [Populus trichocarpa]|nr:hypothetical protein BDE02_07G044200 [Populus trichocarpa]